MEEIGTTNLKESIESRLQALEDNPEELVSNHKDMINERVEELWDENKELNNRISSLENEPDKWVEGMIRKSEDTIQNLPDREANGDNETMKDHIKIVKSNLENNPDEIITNRLNRWNTSKQRNLSRISELEDELEMLIDDPDTWVEEYKASLERRLSNMEEQ